MTNSTQSSHIIFTDILSSWRNDCGFPKNTAGHHCKDFLLSFKKNNWIILVCILQSCLKELYSMITCFNRFFKRMIHFYALILCTVHTKFLLGKNSTWSTPLNTQALILIEILPPNLVPNVIPYCDHWSMTLGTAVYSFRIKIKVQICIWCSKVKIFGGHQVP